MATALAMSEEPIQLMKLRKIDGGTKPFSVATSVVMAVLIAVWVPAETLSFYRTWFVSQRWGEGFTSCTQPGKEGVRTYCLRSRC